MTHLSKSAVARPLFRLNQFKSLIFLSATLILCLLAGTLSAVRAATLTVPAGGDFQAALNVAQPGDTIVLTAGATYTDWFTLPAKNGTSYITIQSSALAQLPAAGVRVSPSNAAQMPKILSPGSGAALRTAPGASYYNFIGIEFAPVAANVYIYDLITLGDGSPAQNSLTQVPHHLTFDRCYIHAYPTQELKRGIALNSANTDILNSYIASFKAEGQDAQAIQGSNGPGPFKIINNYLEGAGENLMFGGSDPSILNLVPSDIEIRRNHFYKPLSWRVGDPSFVPLPSGGHWTVKNLLELKNARRVVIEGNVMENCWEDAQLGTAVTFTPRNQGGGAPWTVLEDVTFRNNIIRHASTGVGMISTDDINKSGFTRRIQIVNNLFYDLNSETWGGLSRMFYLGVAGGEDWVIDHNTAYFASYGGFQCDSALRVTRLTINNNIFRRHFLVGGDAGTDALNIAAGTTWDFRKNVVVENNLPTYYPTTTFNAASFNDVGFVNLTGNDYHLASTSPYKNQGTDGKDIGADIEAINAATTSSTPFTGTPIAVPAIIEAENFDNGGEGVAYHDTDAGNNGGVYRSTDVDIRTRSTASNGYDVYNVYPGEWLKYTINVTAPGIYSLGASVACEMEGGTFHFEVDGTDVTGPMKAPTTGYWGTFQTISKGGINLTAGTHVLRLVLDNPGYYGVIADFDTINIVQ